MNERLSFLEDVKPLPASDQLRFVMSVISKGFMKNPDEIERALTPILVALEVMEAQQVLLNDLLEAKRVKKATKQEKRQAKQEKRQAKQEKRLKKEEKRQAKIERCMREWGLP